MVLVRKSWQEIWVYGGDIYIYIARGIVTRADHFVFELMTSAVSAVFFFFYDLPNTSAKLTNRIINLFKIHI